MSLTSSDLNFYKYKSAIEESFSNIEKEKRKEIKDTLTLIDKAMADGKSSIVIYRFLLPITIPVLEEIGCKVKYAIEFNANGTYNKITLVNWDDGNPYEKI